MPAWRCASWTRGRRDRARARSPGCGSAWSPRPRSATRCGVPVHGVCSLDAIAADARPSPAGRRPAGGHRRPPPRGLLGGLRRRRPPACDGPHVEAPAVLRRAAARRCGVSVAAGGSAALTGLPVHRAGRPQPGRSGRGGGGRAARRGRARPAGAALPAPSGRRRARPAQAGERRVTATIHIDPLRPADAARCAELERLLFPGDDPWSERAFRDELRAGHHYLAARRPARSRVAGACSSATPGWRSWPAHRGPRRRSTPSASTRPTSAAASAGRCCAGCWRWPTPRPPPVFLEVRTDNDAARALYEAERLHRGRAAQALLPAQRRRRPHHATGTTHDRPRDRDLLRRDRRRHRPPRTGRRADAAGQRGRLLGRRARPLRRRGARGRVPGPPAGDGPRRAPRAGHSRGVGRRRRRGRRHRRARADRRAAGRGGRGQGLRRGLGGAAVRGQPPVRARRGGHPAARPAAAVPGPAGLRRPLQPARRARPGRPGHPARRDHRRRRRRGVRQGGPAARAAVPRRPAHRPGGPRRRSGRHRLPARPHRAPGRAVRLLLLRAEDRGGPARRGAGAGRHRRCRSRTSRPASRRPWSTCSRRKAVRAARERGMDTLLLGGGVAANSRLRALAQQRCDAAGITLRVPRPGPVHRQRRDGRRARRAPAGRRRHAVAARPARRLVAAGHRGPGLAVRDRPRVTR